MIAGYHKSDSYKERDKMWFERQRDDDQIMEFGLPNLNANEERSFE